MTTMNEPDEIVLAGPTGVIGHLSKWWAVLTGRYVLIARQDFSNDNLIVARFRTRFSRKAYNTILFERPITYDEGRRVNDVIEKIVAINALWGIRTYVIQGSLDDSPWSVCQREEG